MYRNKIKLSGRQVGRYNKENTTRKGKKKKKKTEKYLQL